MSEEFGTVLTEQELKDRSSMLWPYKIFDPWRPVDTEEVDELLKGFIDIHVHGAPAGAWLKGRPTMVQNSIDASNSHMAALVFKDHNCMNNNCAIIAVSYTHLDVYKRQLQDRDDETGSGGA